MSPENSSQTTPEPEKAKASVFEGMALLLLSLATVGTAWCSYESASWNGVAGGLSNQSVAASRRAAAYQLQAYQVALLDVMLFSEHINARAASNAELARFYSDRFRGEAKIAFDAWLATRPFENTNAPPHPFVTNLYHPHLLTEASLANDESQRLAKQAGDAGRTGRGYVLVTVLLASALFCGGTAPKFDSFWIRRAVLGLGLAAFVFAVGQLIMLPVQL
jgi:hypothetical protein